KPSIPSWVGKLVAISTCDCFGRLRKVNTGLAYYRKISCGAGDPATGLMTIVTCVLKSLRNGISSALGVNTDSVVLYLYLYSGASAETRITHQAPICIRTQGC